MQKKSLKIAETDSWGLRNVDNFDLKGQKWNSKCRYRAEVSYPENPDKIINDADYTKQQIFSVAETTLHWKTKIKSSIQITKSFSTSAVRLFC
jgi:hypothetical protein